MCSSPSSTPTPMPWSSTRIPERLMAFKTLAHKGRTLLRVLSFVLRQSFFGHCKSLSQRKSLEPFCLKCYNSIRTKH